MDDVDLLVKQEERREARAKKKRLSASIRPSASHCIECDKPIPQLRRVAVPGVELCIECQTLAEEEKKR